MRGYKSIIQEAELLAMSPESVAEFLKRRARESEEDCADPVDEETEGALRDRSLPLIDLALARYARSIETLRPIFQNSQPGGALRLAVLSNAACRAFTLIGFPVELFGERKQEAKGQAAVWLADAPLEELQALFENPTVDDNFLSDLLERTTPWDMLSDERLTTIVAILGRNERMWTPYNEEMVDGFADTRYHAVFNSAWKLAESVEPSAEWARALSYLFDRLKTYAFSIKEPLQLVNRWQLAPSKSELLKKEAKENQRGWLSDHQGVRKGLAKLALSNTSALLPRLLSSPDLALRAAAYADGCMTPEQLSAAYQQDGKMVFEQAKNNLHIWRISGCRDVLHKIAWAEDSPDWYPGLYNNLQAKIARDHPDWFEEESTQCA
jgi:hypothetical protein